MKQYQSQIQENDSQIDITNDLCPITFVKTKLFLEDKKSGQIVQIRLRAGEPLDNIPATLRDEGHNILSLEAESGDEEIWILRVEVGP